MAPPPGFVWVGATVDASRLFREHLARQRELGAARGPLEQLHAELVLERLDLLAQRRLADAERFGGLREIRCGRDGQKVAEMPEFHA